MRKEPHFFENDPEERHSDKSAYFNLDKRCLYKRNPTNIAYRWVEISTWTNTDPHDSLWIRLKCGPDDIIVSSEEIIALADTLKRMKRVRRECWKK